VLSLFEFSCQPGPGFRMSMAERVSRQFEASRSKFERQCVLRPVGVRCVTAVLSSAFSTSASRSSASRYPVASEYIRSRPRSFASSGDAPRAMLDSMVSKFKRAAAVRVSTRLGQRFAQLGPRHLDHDESSRVALRPSSLVLRFQ
jgi:hypothetical protein